MDDLGDRIKAYEFACQVNLTRRIPVIARVDGRAFHSFTRGLDRPFDARFQAAMQATAIELCKGIAGAKLAYVQSDEISILITNNDTLDTQPWFDNNLQKIVSIAASLATVKFNRAIPEEWRHKNPHFDGRAFILPPAEVVNYFIWREQDCSRNSIQMAARAQFSHKSLHGLNTSQLQDKLWSEAKVNWNDYPTTCKRGACIVKQKKEVNGVERSEWVVDKEIPIFSQDRNYILSRFVTD